MRRFFPLTLLAATLFLVPVLVSAQSNCANVGSSCLLPDNSSGVCASGELGNQCIPGATTGVNTSGAQTTGVNTGTNVTLVNPLKSGASLESFLTNILQFVIRIGAIAVVLMLVFVGYKFVVAQGSESALVEARKMLLWTVIGALVLLGAQAIASAIRATVAALGG